MYTLNNNNIYTRLFKKSPILLQALTFHAKQMEETNAMINRAIAGNSNCPSFTKNVAANNYFRTLEDHGQRTEQWTDRDVTGQLFPLFDERTPTAVPCMNRSFYYKHVRGDFWPERWHESTWEFLLRLDPERQIVNRITRATEQPLLLYRWDRIQLCKKVHADSLSQYRREMIHRAAHEKNMHLSDTNPDNLYDADPMSTLMVNRPNVIRIESIQMDAFHWRVLSDKKLKHRISADLAFRRNLIGDPLEVDFINNYTLSTFITVLIITFIYFLYRRLKRKNGTTI